jgi:hypothetical protein
MQYEQTRRRNQRDADERWQKPALPVPQLFQEDTERPAHGARMDVELP